ncbi:MAG TPA: EI24 domain-containing protein [Vicinamibacteria bacterium]|nr:EI24 domain-containing protein [Vicinamibacteria bacterium]
MSEQSPARIARPGLLRRAAAGAWHVPAGFALLLRNPSLWPLALLPALLVVLSLAGGLLLAAFAGPSVEGALAHGRERLPSGLGLLMTLLRWLGMLEAGMLLGLSVALLAAAPLLDRLARRVESPPGNGGKDRAPRPRAEPFASLQGSLYFLAAAPGVFLLGLVPLAGPILATLWGAHALSVRLTAGPLGQRGLGFQARQVWHKDWRAESLGFGLAGLLTLVVPVANLLLGPALAIGGTLLVLDLEELAPPAPGATGP